MKSCYSGNPGYSRKVACLNIVNKNYQQNAWVLYTFVLNISFGQLLDILPKNVILKTFDSEFAYIEVWLTDQNFKPLKIDDKTNITLVINWSITYTKWQAIQFNREIKYL